MLGFCCWLWLGFCCWFVLICGILLLALVGVLLLVRTRVLLLRSGWDSVVGFASGFAGSGSSDPDAEPTDPASAAGLVVESTTVLGDLETACGERRGNLVARVALGLIRGFIVAIATGMGLAIILHFAVRGLLPLALGALLVPWAVHRTIRFCPRLAPFGSICLGIVITGIPITIG